eukprot:2994718-Amphidinium_carterae.1
MRDVSKRLRATNMSTGCHVVHSQAIRKSRHCVGGASVHLKCQRDVCVAKHWLEFLDGRKRKPFARPDLFGLAAGRLSPFS